VTLRRREASVTGFGGGDADVCALTLRLVELMEVLPWWGGVSGGGIMGGVLRSLPDNFTTKTVSEATTHRRHSSTSLMRLGNFLGGRGTTAPFIHTAQRNPRRVAPGADARPTAASSTVTGTCTTRPARRGSTSRPVFGDASATLRTTRRRSIVTEHRVACVCRSAETRHARHRSIDRASRARVRSSRVTQEGASPNLGAPRRGTRRGCDRAPRTTLPRITPPAQRSCTLAPAQQLLFDLNFQLAWYSFAPGW
jgi:hypothetical protein